jgi:TrmH family RNA methyltransferase
MTRSALRPDQRAWLRELRRSAAARRREGVYLLEGLRFLRDAVASGARLRTLVLCGDALAEDLAERAAEVLVVRERDARGLFDTRTPQGVLGILDRPARRLEEAHARRAVLALDGVADPGNVGTLVRTAAALTEGAAVIVGAGCADPFGPKAARAAAGALAAVPVIETDRLEDALVALHAGGRRVLGLDAAASEPIGSVDGPFALVVGGEAAGIRAAVRSVLDDTVALVVPPRFESLNAAVAGALALWTALGLGCAERAS